MDPLVFNIITSDSESASSSAMKSHPGDCAAPLDILEWLDKFDEKIESTSYGQVRRGQIPAALLRSTGPSERGVPMTLLTSNVQRAPSAVRRVVPPQVLRVRDKKREREKGDGDNTQHQPP